MATGKKEFAVQVSINASQKEVLVKSEETSDGAPYYVGFVNGEEITQLREEETGWKQIWGNLSDSDIISLGNAISEWAKTE